MDTSTHPIAKTLELIRHPEGGWFRRVYASETLGPRGRPVMTSILYLLTQGERSRWHVVDADEAWHFHEGASITLHVYDPRRRALELVVLGAASAGFRSTWVVPAGCWQAATVSGAHGLVGCTVAPGFDFAGFQLVSDLPNHEEHMHGEMDRYRGLL